MIKQNAELMNHLVQSGFPCLPVVLNKIEIFDRPAILMEYCDRGDYVSAENEAIKNEQIRCLADLTTRLLPIMDKYSGQIKQKILAKDSLWETPHSNQFNFEKTILGSEWIEEKAKRTKEIINNQAYGRIVLTHYDWSNKHLRFQNGKVTIVYDWDSLSFINELYMLGIASATYLANWDLKTKMVPSKEEAKSIVLTYEKYMNINFTEKEIEVISAYCAYSLCYWARCVHSVDPLGAKSGELANAINEIIAGKYF
jgi:uncharacterized protein YktA (UPF0223 family)